MKYLSVILFLAAQAAPVLLSAQCNRALNCDGDGDQVYAALPLGAADFALELWFTSEATDVAVSCDATNYRRLLSLEKTTIPTALFEIGECNGEITVLADGVFYPTGSGNIRNNGWHHLALTWSAAAQSYEVLLNCNSLFAGNVPGGMAMENLTLGGALGAPDPLRDWKGSTDEVRVWDFIPTPVDICTGKNCPLYGDEQGLILYWPFDQGEAGGNNTGILQADDLSGNGHPGALTGFALIGSASNFVCSGAFAITPYLMRTELTISDYPDLVQVTEICDGDPVQFCLPGVLALPPLGSQVTTTWQSGDGTGNWTDITDPLFNSVCFLVPAGMITAACAGNPAGYVDLHYRVKFEIDYAGGTPYTCVMYSETADLRVCCPVSNIPAADFMLTTDIQDDLLCEDDIVTYTVMLVSPDIFVQNPGPEVDITWTYNGDPIPYDDMLSFTYTAPLAVVPPEVCIEATITNCALKSKTFRKCLPIEPHSQCGSIGSLTDPAILMPDGSDPNLFYICPGNAAVLGIVDASDFMHCTPNWEYSFDNISWNSLGNTNSTQNTNLLPSYYWPGWPDYVNDRIYYRVNCIPFLNPTGCDPCYSNNTIEIRLREPVAPDVILGNNQICKPFLPEWLTVNNPDPDYTYTWYCNGLPFPESNLAPFPATMTANYWVEIANGCPGLEYTTPWHSLEVCEVKAQISCPFPPNECVEPGEQITISACLPDISLDNCTGNHQFSWSASNGGPGGASGPDGCNFTHTPDPSGTIYTVTVTNTDTGCSDTVSILIVPCDTN